MHAIIRQFRAQIAVFIREQRRRVKQIDSFFLRQFCKNRIVFSDSFRCNLFFTGITFGAARINFLKQQHGVRLDFAQFVDQTAQLLFEN